MMALTATATKATRISVCRTLGMVSPAIVSTPPNRPNIKYIVKANPGSLEEAFAPLVEEIRHRHTRMDRVIIIAGHMTAVPGYTCTYDQG